MLTTNLLKELKDKIALVLKMSMFQQAAKAPVIVIDSVKVIESLNNDRVSDSKKIAALEEKLNSVHATLTNHIKTGR
jgi:hypothetical protein